MTGGASRVGVRVGLFALFLAACSSEEEGAGATPGDAGGLDAGAGGSQASTGGGGGGGLGSGGMAGSSAAGGAGGTSGGTGSGGASEAGTTDDGSAGSGGSAGGPNVDTSDAMLHEFELDPQVVDPSVVDSLAVQYAQLDTRTAPLGKLVIFLPGATNVPRDWRDHGRVLAGFGFHVLIPHYNNRWSSGTNLCDGVGGSCALDTRWEALVGEDASSVVDIARADSAEGRVVTMIHHLTTAHPGGDWGYYLGAADELLYDRMIIAGISHGAASSGLYAIRRPFTRNVMHASGPAGSTSEEKQTPLSEWYGFVHTEDPAYDAITSSWDTFALLGEPTSIDGQSAPFNDSHRLITSEPSSYPHGSVAAHGSSPTDSSGNYIFEAAWRYLYGVPAP